MIVMYHYTIYSGWRFHELLSLNRVSTLILGMGGKTGVNLFIMITGYFMIKSHAKWQSLVKLWIEVTIMALVMYLAVVLPFHIRGSESSVLKLIHAMFPVVYRNWWFISVYSMLYILIPFINRAVQGITKQQYRLILLVGALPIVIWPIFYSKIGMSYSHIIWFIFIYLIGGYMRMFPEDYQKLTIKRNILIIVGIVAVATGLTLLILKAKTLPGTQLNFVINDVLGWRADTFVGRNSSSLMLLLAIFLFTLFSKFTMKTNPIINVLGKASIGVYLLQSTPALGSRFMYQHIFHGAASASTIHIVLYGIFVVVMLYLAGTLVYLVLRPLNMLFDWLIVGNIEKVVARKVKADN